MERTFCPFLALDDWLQQCTDHQSGMYFRHVSPSRATRAGDRKCFFCTKSKLWVKDHLWSARNKVIGYRAGTRLSAQHTEGTHILGASLM